jgi:hypothetical protein
MPLAAAASASVASRRVIVDLYFMLNLMGARRAVSLAFQEDDSQV